MCFLCKMFKKNPKKDQIARNIPKKGSKEADFDKKALKKVENDPKSTPKRSKNDPKKCPLSPITVKKYLMGRDKEFPLDKAKIANTATLLNRVNSLLEKFGAQRELRSGYRPGYHNTNAGGSKRSTHKSCEGIDISDTDDLLKKWILANKSILEKLDLTMEDPDYTDTWVHLQTKRVKSGRRIYIPY